MCSINNCDNKSYIGSYIGETGWPLKYRINEHKKAVLKGNINNSMIAAQFKLTLANAAAGDRSFTVYILDKCYGLFRSEHSSRCAILLYTNLI